MELKILKEEYSKILAYYSTMAYLLVLNLWSFFLHP
jgi:hypothetical protein